MASANTLAFNFVANDRASKTFDKLAGKSDTLGSKLAKFGKTTAIALGATAVTGVAALGAAFVKGAKDAASFEVLGKKTAAVIKSTGNVAKISVGGVQKLAGSLESLSGVDEELIINSQNVLATFTKVRNETGKGNDIFNQGAKAALNMSVALGTDLQGATIQVGKALNDPIRGVTALRRAGVQLTTQQEAQIKKMVEAGDVMGAQKVILKELETQFGGAAKAAGDTFTGKIARAKDALSDMARDIGAKAIPALGALADWVTNTFAPRLTTAFGFITDVFRGIFGGGGGREIETASSRLKIAKQRLADLQTQASKGIGTPGGEKMIQAEDGSWVPESFYKGGKKVRIGSRGKSAFAKQIEQAQREVEEAGKNLVASEGKATQSFGQKLGERVGEIGRTLVAKAKEWGSSLVDVAKGWATNIIGGVKTGLDTGDWSGLGGSLGSGLGRAIRGATKAIAEIGEALADLFEKVDWFKLGKDIAKEAPSFALGFIEGLMDGIVKAAKEHPAAFFTAVLSLLFAPSKLIGPLKAALGKIPLVGTFAAWLVGGINKLGAPVRGVVAWFSRNFAKGFSDDFGKFFPAVRAKLGGWLETFRVTVFTKFDDMRKAGARFVQGIGAGIRQAGKLVTEALGFIIRTMLAPFKDAGVWLVRAGGSVVRGLGSGIRTAVGLVWDATRFIGRSVLGGFADAGRWLVRAGGSVIGGLKGGIVGAVRGIGGWIKRSVVDPIVGAVKRFFGIRSPSTVFAGIGGNLVSGLMRGMASTSGTAIARKIFGDMPSALGAIVQKGLVSIASLPGRALRALGGLGGKLAGLLGLGGGGGGAAPINANAALGQNLAANLYGWKGAQWNALNKLIMGESGWRNTAQNPTSSAYGIFQFLNSTWGAMGYRKTSDPATQIRAGLAYIRQTYGSPVNAYGAWASRSPHWYDKGGVLPPGLTLAVNNTGRNEHILTDAQMRRRGRGGDGATVVINVSGSVYDVQRFKAEVATAVREGLRTGHIRIA